MNYERQIEEIVNYFKSHEKNEEDYRIGVEFEHFVIYKDSLKTVSYYGQGGVEETLRELIEIGYEAQGEGEHVLGVSKEKKHVTLEPGSQLELSIDADISIEEIEEEYIEFMEDLLPILEKKGQELIAVGYHPETKIDEITLLPKQRYDYMFNYFKTKGSHAHNMMKGTSALQVSLDFSSEEDYNKKFRVSNALSPVLYAMFENAYYFEGEITDKHNLRCHIWINCDLDRSGVVRGGLDKDFGYRDYAEYILNKPPIFIYEDGQEVYTENKLVRELFDPEDYTVDELEHMLTMFFPDVRTKKFVEIRMMDSLPYPLNFSVVAMLKGLLYNQDNLDQLDEYTKDITFEDVEKSKLEMRELGLQAHLRDKKIIDIARYIFNLSKKGLEEDELSYLEPLADMLEAGLSPYEITKEKASLGKRESLEWAILNNSMEEK